MATKRGKPSRNGRGRSILVDALVVLGIAASLGLVAVSVALNARMGFASADNALDGKVYGAGAGFADVLKALAPFMLAWSIRQRDVLAGSSAGLLFVVCTGYSLASSFGFAAEHRASKAAVARAGMDGHSALLSRKRRLEGRLDFLGEQRSAAEISEAMRPLLAGSAWKGGPSVEKVSKGCAVDRAATRVACRSVGLMREELARAEEADGLRAGLTEIERALAANTDPVAAVTDVQVDALVKVFSVWAAAVNDSQVGLGVSLLLALVLEVGSGLGLYMVTTPWRSARTPSRKAKPDKRTAAPDRLGHVDSFMLARVGAGEGRLSVAALYADYLHWCGTMNAAPYAMNAFEERFLALAQELSLAVTHRRGTVFVGNVMLMPSKGVHHAIHQGGKGRTG